MRIGSHARPIDTVSYGVKKGIERPLAVSFLIGEIGWLGIESLGKIAFPTTIRAVARGALTLIE